MYICIDKETAKRENIRLSTVTTMQETFVMSNAALQCVFGKGHFFLGIREISLVLLYVCMICFDHLTFMDYKMCPLKKVKAAF